jgi:hypothetical protein
MMRFAFRISIPLPVMAMLCVLAITMIALGPI